MVVAMPTQCGRDARTRFDACPCVHLPTLDLGSQTGSTWASLPAGRKQLSKSALEEHAVTAARVNQPPALARPIQSFKELIDYRSGGVDRRRVVQLLDSFCTCLIYLAQLRMLMVNRFCGHSKFLDAPGTPHPLNG
jgi:hypothetical protein